LLCLGSSTAYADSGRLFSTRSINPFTQIFGLPMQPSVQSSEAGKWETHIVYQIVNHADMASEGEESIVLDGESDLTSFMLSYGVNERWRIGVDLPYVSHQAGNLDGFIYDWHDLWGISNSKRMGPDDLLNFDYSRSGAAQASIVDRASGIGDLRLWADYKLRDGGSTGTSIHSRVTVKLPTGDEADLHGSGAMDVAADVIAQRRLHQGKTYLDIVGHFGLLVLGDGEVLASQQEDLVPYGGAGLVWGVSDSIEIVLQASAEGSYFDSDLDELGGTSLQLTVGGRYRWPAHNIELAVGIVEDLVSDATPDVAFHFELRKGF
jgi:hypothetical protein